METAGMLGRATCQKCGTEKSITITLPASAELEDCQFCGRATQHREMIHYPLKEQVQVPCARCVSMRNMLLRVLDEQYGINIRKILAETFEPFGPRIP